MQNKKILYILYSFGVVIFLITFYILFILAPGDFPDGATFQVAPGMSLHSVSLKLEQAHIIRSRLAFEAFVFILGKGKVVSTDYFFENSIPVYEVARRISKGDNHVAPIAVTIPEGFDVTQIAYTFSIKLINFNKSKFLALAKPKEGYLFPDTYFFLHTDNENDVLEAMSENFNKKTSSLLPAISSSGKTEKEIIIMASIVEKEAKGDVDRAVIAGILWKRISIGMALQVDAAPETYKARGLPKSPISNPGLDAIKATLYPKNSPYIYYLHDKNGAVHYAKTLAEHDANIIKYLK